jgi:hypothetical protein
MTRNQQRALFLAQAVIDGSTHPADMSDEEWALLLLASDMNTSSLSPIKIAHRVLLQFEHRMGFFRVDDGQWEYLTWQ